jgi:hypothetical protein
MLVAEHDDMVEHFPFGAAHKALSDGVHVRARTAVLITRVPAAAATRSKDGPSFSSRSRSKISDVSPSIDRQIDAT